MLPWPARIHPGTGERARTLLEPSSRTLLLLVRRALPPTLPELRGVVTDPAPRQARQQHSGPSDFTWLGSHRRIDPNLLGADQTRLLLLCVVHVTVPPTSPLAHEDQSHYVTGVLMAGLDGAHRHIAPGSASSRPVVTATSGAPRPTVPQDPGWTPTFFSKDGPAGGVVRGGTYIESYMEQLNAEPRSLRSYKMDAWDPDRPRHSGAADPVTATSYSPTDPARATSYSPKTGISPPVRSSRPGYCSLVALPRLTPAPRINSPVLEARP